MKTINGQKTLVHIRGRTPVLRESSSTIDVPKPIPKYSDFCHLFTNHAIRFSTVVKCSIATTFTPRLHYPHTHRTMRHSPLTKGVKCVSSNGLLQLGHTGDAGIFQFYMKTEKEKHQIRLLWFFPFLGH